MNTLTIAAVGFLTSFFVFFTALPPAAAQGPVAWWTFDEADGTTAADSSGNGNDGTLNGDAVFDPAGGMFGGAVSLDGDGDFVDVPDADGLEFPQGQDYSITLFFNSGGNPSDNNNGLVSKGYANNPRSPDGYYLLQVTPSGLFEFDSRGPDAIGTPRARSGQVGPDITDGIWHNVTLVRDYAANEIRSYIDGMLESTIAMNATDGGDWNMGVNNESLQIGDHLDRFTTGMFDDVALWNRVLTQAEIDVIILGGVQATLGGVAVFFNTEPAVVLSGDAARLNWQVEPGATVTIDNGVGDVTGMTDAEGNGSIEVTPTETTIYSMTADNGIVSEDLSTTVTVKLLDTFEAGVTSVSPGGTATLSWLVSANASVSIDQGVGNVDAQTVDGVGSIEVTLQAGTTYSLTATEGANSETAMVTINVVVATDGPVAYWPFDEAEGTTAADLSGSANEHPAELLDGATFDPVGGLFGGAVVLNADSQEVRAPDHEDYEFAQGVSFSITLFFNSDGEPSDTNNGLVTKGYGDDPRSNDGYYLLQVTNSGLVEFDSRCCAGGDPRTRTGQVGPNITDGSWHNVTFVRDYDAGNYRTYVDGVSVSTVVLNAADGGDWNMGVNDQDVVIGDHLNRWTRGRFDDIAIWRRVLSDDEIATINAGGVAPLLGPQTPFEITDVAINAGRTEASVSWNSKSNRTYAIDTSDDLQIWQELDDGVASGGDQTTFIDSSIAGTPVRYDRVREIQ